MELYQNYVQVHPAVSCLLAPQHIKWSSLPQGSHGGRCHIANVTPQVKYPLVLSDIVASHA